MGSVLVKRDQIAVYRPATMVDAHGWAEKGPVSLVGEFDGTIQQTVPTSDRSATERAGEGPWEPAHRRRATGYLPTKLVEPGDLLEYRDVRWLVESVRLVEDPRGSGELDCWVCDLSEWVDFVDVVLNPPSGVTYNNGGTYDQTMTFLGVTP